MTAKELRRAVAQTSTFKLGEGFLLDITCNAERDPCPEYEAWLWHKNYGVKELLYGANQEYDDFIDTALYYAEDFKDYYAEKYMGGITE